MLTHIHPSLHRFAVRLVVRISCTTFTRLCVLRWYHPTTAMCREPLCPQQVLPLTLWHPAPHQRALPLLHRSYWLMRQTKTLPSTSVVPNTTGLRRLPPVPAGRWTFPTLLCKSFTRCLGPYPGGLLWCLCPLLPIETSAFPMRTQGRLSYHYRRATSLRGAQFRGCSHSFTFRPPALLTTQVAPTAVQ